MRLGLCVGVDKSNATVLADCSTGGLQFNISSAEW
jgi:hypothetical protein